MLYNCPSNRSYEYSMSIQANHSSPTIYLDMDGVIANFIKPFFHLADHYGVVYVSKTDANEHEDFFFKTILEEKIFEFLPTMKNAQKIVALVKEMSNKYRFNVEMLTSANTYNVEVFNEVLRQKKAWLEMHGIDWKINLVSKNHEKANFAHKHSILIDDSASCVEPFAFAGGATHLFVDYDSLETCLPSLCESILNNKVA